MLTNIAEKLGILDIVAPWIEGNDEDPNQRSQSRTQSKSQKANTTSNPSSRSRSSGDRTGSTSQRANPSAGSGVNHGNARGSTATTSNNSTKRTRDEDSAPLEKNMVLEATKEREKQKRKITILKAQKEEEERSSKVGQFAKKQRVSYHHRATNKRYDAVIIGVHLDDGPDKPYYTIKYNQTECFVDACGVEEEKECTVEKQTNPDRLTALPWDEDKTWELIRK